MKKLSKNDAVDKIMQLFTVAETARGTRQSLADAFVKKARRIAMKHRISLPRNIKRKFCKYCGAYFIAGKNYRVRMKEKKVIYTCLTCKRFMRFRVIK